MATARVVQNLQKQVEDLRRSRTDLLRRLGYKWNCQVKEESGRLRFEMVSGEKTHVIRNRDGKQQENERTADGRLVSGFFGPKSRAEWLKRVVCMRSDDVVVCTFPKCGTTFMVRAIAMVPSRKSCLLK